MPRVDRTDAAWAGAWILIVGYLAARDFYPGWTGFRGPGLGPLPVSSFGVLLLLDFLFGWYLVRRVCLRRGLDWEGFQGDLIWIVLGGFYLSHLVSIALYFPDRLSDPLALLDVRTGISSFGGIFGGGALAVWALRRRKRPVWAYVDVLVYGFVGRYIFGRAGCFSVHDHPGIETDFFLAVEIDGVLRHDLGFYEMLLMAGLLVLLTAIGVGSTARPGLITAWAASVYGPARFFLDSLRVDDPRYGSLTPGQWFCLVTVLVAAWAWVTVARAGHPRSAVGEHVSDRG